MLATDKGSIPLLKPEKEYIFLNEHLEHAMEREQLDRVITKYNRGMHISDISKTERRHPAEVLLALIHQSTCESKNKSDHDIERPFARIL